MLTLTPAQRKSIAAECREFNATASTPVAAGAEYAHLPGAVQVTLKTRGARESRFRLIETNGDITAIC